MAEGVTGVQKTWLDELGGIAMDAGKKIIAAKVDKELEDTSSAGLNGSKVSDPVQDAEGVGGRVSGGSFLPSGINKPILYGSLALLALAVVLKLVKK